MDPYQLSVWVSIGSDRKVFKPTTKAILERYMAKFSKVGKMDLIDDFGLAPAPAPTGTVTGSRVGQQSSQLPTG